MRKCFIKKEIKLKYMLLIDLRNSSEFPHFYIAFKMK